MDNTYLCELLNTTKQKFEESITDWRDRIEELAEKANNGEKKELGTRQLVLRFILGLQNQDAKIHLLHKDPPTIEECVKLYKLYESTQTAINWTPEKVQTIGRQEQPAKQVKTDQETLHQ